MKQQDSEAWDIRYRYFDVAFVLNPVFGGNYCELLREIRKLGYTAWCRRIYFLNRVEIEDQQRIWEEVVVTRCYM